MTTQKQLSAPVGTLSAETTALNDAIRAARRAGVGDDWLALEVRRLREHIEGYTVTVGKSVREKASDGFLGLPGLHQTVANQTQARKELMDAQASSSGDPGAWRANADHKWWEKK